MSSDEGYYSKKQLREMKFDADAEKEYREQLADRVRATQTKISRLSVEKAIETPEPRHS